MFRPKLRQGGLAVMLPLKEANTGEGMSDLLKRLRSSPREELPAVAEEAALRIEALEGALRRVGEACSDAVDVASRALEENG